MANANLDCCDNGHSCAYKLSSPVQKCSKSPAKGSSRGRMGENAIEGTQGRSPYLVDRALLDVV